MRIHARADFTIGVIASAMIVGVLAFQMATPLASGSAVAEDSNVSLASFAEGSPTEDQSDPATSPLDLPTPVLPVAPLVATQCGSVGQEALYRASVDRTPADASTTTAFAVGQAAELVSNAVSVSVPGDAAVEPLRFEHVPLRSAHDCAWRAIDTFELNAYAVERGDALVTQFDKPVTVSVAFTEHDLRGLDRRTLRLAYLDEVAEEWVEMTSTYDAQTLTLSAETDHFSVFGSQALPAYSQPGQVFVTEADIQTGSSVLRYPFDLPDAPGGFKPSLTATYHSGSVNGMKNSRDVGSWVGLGWDLHMGRVTYNEETDKYAVDLGGGALPLVLHQGTWHTTPDAHLKIVPDTSSADIEDHKWEVWDPQGVYFLFGGSTNTVDYRDTDPATNGCQCVIYRYDLNYMQDPNGNRIRVTYAQDKVDGTIRSSYFSKIEYGTSTEGSYPIELVSRINYHRNDTPSPVPPVVENGALEQLTVTVKGTQARRFHFRYLDDTLHRLTGFYEERLVRSTVTDDAVGCWPLEGDTFDECGTNHLSSVNGYHLAGQRELGAEYPDGDYSWVADAPALDITGDLSISAWIAPDVPVNSGHQMILQKDNAYALMTYQSVTGGSMSRLRLELAKTGGASWFWASTTEDAITNNGTWQHVAVTREMSTGEIKFYIDGVQHGDTQIYPTWAIDDTEYKLYLGGKLDRAIGGIDEVRLYERVLPATKVADLASAGQGSTFGYTDLGINLNRATATDIPLEWPFLTVSTTPFDGRASYAYTEIPQGSPVDDWTRQTVATLTIDADPSGVTDSVPITTTYTYPSAPDYKDHATNPWLDEFHGFSRATETRDDGTYVEHSYYTSATRTVDHPTLGQVTRNDEGHASGREYRSAVYDAGGTEVQSNFSDWHVEFPTSSTTVYDVHLDNTVTTVGTRHLVEEFTYDENGNTTKQVSKGDSAYTGDEVTVLRGFTPNLSANILSLPDFERTYEGDSTAAEDQVGESRFYYDSNGFEEQPTQGLLTRTDSYTDATGFVTATTTSDAFGNVISAIAPGGTRTDYVFDSALHTYVTEVRYATIAGDQLIERYTWDTVLGVITTATDVADQGTAYTYDNFGRLTSIIGPGDSVASPTQDFAYLDWGKPGKQRTRIRTKVSESEYLWRDEYFDGLGRQLQVRGPDEDGESVITSSVKFDSRGLSSNQYVAWRVPATTSDDYQSPPGGTRSTRSAYDALGRVVVATGVDDALSLRSWAAASAGDDSMVWQETVTDPRGNQRRTTTDSRGNLARVEELDDAGMVQATSTYDYDPFGNLLTFTDAVGNQSTAAFDWLSRKSASQDPDLGTWSSRFDSAGNVLVVTDARGVRQVSSHDPLGRLTGARPVLTGPISYWPFDDPFTFGLTVEDIVGSNDGTITGAGSATGRFGDALDFDGVDDYVLVSDDNSLDPTGDLTIAAWIAPDSSGENSYGRIVDKRGGQLTYGLFVQSNGSLGFQGRSGGTLSSNASVLTYDGSWQHVAITRDTVTGDVVFYVDGVAVGSATDTAGPLHGSTGDVYIGNLSSLSQTFDGNIDEVAIFDRLLSADEVFSLAKETVTISYDDTTGGNNGKGRQTKVEDASGAAELTYDSRGRLTQSSRSIDTASYVLEFGDDDVGRITSITYPDGSTVTQDYDTRGLPRSLMLGGSTVVDDTTYNALGGPVQLTLGNGTFDRFGYYGTGGAFDSGDDCSPDLSDCFGRLYELALTGANDPNTAQYTWDGAGNLTTRLDTGSSDQEDFTFDYVDRVTLASKSYDANDSFTFDVTGNLTDLAGATYTYDAAKVHAAIQVGTVTYDYDANGNMTTRGSQTLTWDAANRLQYVDVGGVRIATYTYDAAGMRIKKTENGETTVYVGRYYEKNLTTGVETLYLYLGEQLVAYEVDDNLRYLHRDHLGSTAVVTDVNGDVVFERTYDAWGNVRTASGTADTDRLYTGQRFDAATGLYYYNARYYDPTIGRFVSPDLLVPNAGDPQVWNRYAYVLNNPLRFTDPSGHCVVRNPRGHFEQTKGDYLECTTAELGALDWSLAQWWASYASNRANGFFDGRYIGLLGELVNDGYEGLLYLLGLDENGRPWGASPASESATCTATSAKSRPCEWHTPPPSVGGILGDFADFLDDIDFANRATGAGIVIGGVASVGVAGVGCFVLGALCIPAAGIAYCAAERGALAIPGGARMLWTGENYYSYGPSVTLCTGMP